MLLLKRPAAFRTYRKTCLLKCNFSNAARSRPKSYCAAIKGMFATLALSFLCSNLTGFSSVSRKTHCLVVTLDLIKEGSQQIFVGLEDVLTSSTCLQRNNFHLPRRLEDVLKTSSKDVLKTSWRHLEDEKLLRWRRLQDVSETKTKCLLGISVSNKSKRVYNKSILRKSVSGKSEANSKSLIRTQYFQYSSYFETQAAFLFWKLKFLMTVWCCEISWIQIRHCRTGEAIKTKF